MSEAETIIRALEKELKNTPNGFDFDVFQLSILGNYHYGFEKAENILQAVKVHFESKQYLVTYVNGFFSTWMHGQITIKKK